jgi:hypothetical protein
MVRATEARRHQPVKTDGTPAASGGSSDWLCCAADHLIPSTVPATTSTTSTGLSGAPTSPTTALLASALAASRCGGEPGPGPRRRVRTQVGSRLPRLVLHRDPVRFQGQLACGTGTHGKRSETDGRWVAKCSALAQVRKAGRHAHRLTTEAEHNQFHP